MKQPIVLTFGKGLDKKTDPWLVPMGNFLSLENSIFTTLGQLKKRNGFGKFTSLPESATFLSTFNKNLTAIGSSVQAFSSGTGEWLNKGPLQPVMLSTLPLVRSNTNQSQLDSVVSDNGLVCTVYTDQLNSSLTTPSYKYVIADVTTGQNIIAPTVIIPTGGVVTGSPRVFILGAYFIIVFTTVIAGASHLQYIAISKSNPLLVNPAVNLVSSYEAATTLSWDGVVAENNLYLAYTTSSGGQALKIFYLSSTLIATAPTTYSNAGKVTSTIMSLSADISGASPVIYAAYYDRISSEGYVVSVDQNLNKIIIVPAQFITAEVLLSLTSVASNGVLTVYYEISNAYSYDASIPTNFIKTNTITQAGVVGSASVFVRSVGLASKAFIVGSTYYVMTAYQSPFQNTYFLLNGAARVVARLAYSNGGGYDHVGLPSVTVTGTVAQIGYLIKDFISSANASQEVSVTKGGIYAQTGLNLVSFTIGTSNVVPAEIGQALHLSGGFLWEYDGLQPVEHNFFLWPDSVEGTPVNSGGSMVPQEYQYQAVYTWTDNQGNIHRSAPSIPIIVDMSTNNKAFTQPTPLTFTADLTDGSEVLTSVSSFTGIKVGQIVEDTTTGANIQTGSYIVSFDSGAGTITLNLPVTATAVGDSMSISSICSVTVNIPTLRLTYKLTKPVKIELFRWSVAQQEFFQVTSILLPLLNNTAVDSVSFLDTQADNQIVGNSLIYTTGGVIENIGAPSFNSITLFDDRLWGIDAEDPNLLWYSKQVIENTPVEMSDLFTLYVAPSTAAQGSTGPMKCIFPMDDKLIIFKTNAIYFINGTGPDNLGANSQYSNPIFITSTVGTINQQSIVMTDNGLMFQSDKGYWLLMRSAQQCAYLGAAVEEFTLAGTANSALAIPETTQIRMTMDDNQILMMDYFNNNQWGTFKGVSPISSTLYNNSHTILDKYGNVLQEAPGKYLDGTAPVLLQFQTGWINVAGVSGYQRIYELIFLGRFLSPANIIVNIAYDFRQPIQQSIITPTNYTGVYGSDSLYGQTSPFGGEGPVLQWRVQLDKQKCQTFQITMQEQFDPSFGTVAGAGFTLTGVTGVIDIKKGYRPIKAANTVGSGD